MLTKELFCSREHEELYFSEQSALAFERMKPAPGPTSKPVPVLTPPPAPAAPPPAPEPQVELKPEPEPESAPESEPEPEREPEIIPAVAAYLRAPAVFEPLHPAENRENIEFEVPAASPEKPGFPVSAAERQLLHADWIRDWWPRTPVAPIRETVVDAIAFPATMSMPDTPQPGALPVNIPDREPCMRFWPTSPADTSFARGEENDAVAPEIEARIASPETELRVSLQAAPAVPLASGAPAASHHQPPAPAADPFWSRLKIHSVTVRRESKAVLLAAERQTLPAVEAAESPAVMRLAQNDWTDPQPREAVIFTHAASRAAETHLRAASRDASCVVKSAESPAIAPLAQNNWTDPQPGAAVIPTHAASPAPETHLRAAGRDASRAVKSAESPAIAPLAQNNWTDPQPGAAVIPTHAGAAAPATHLRAAGRDASPSVESVESPASMPLAEGDWTDPQPHAAVIPTHAGSPAPETVLRAAGHDSMPVAAPVALSTVIPVPQNLWSDPAPRAAVIPTHAECPAPKPGLLAARHEALPAPAFATWGRVARVPQGAWTNAQPRAAVIRTSTGFFAALPESAGFRHEFAAPSRGADHAGMPPSPEQRNAPGPPASPRLRYVVPQRTPSRAPRWIAGPFDTRNAAIVAPSFPANAESTQPRAAGFRELKRPHAPAVWLSTTARIAPAPQPLDGGVLALPVARLDFETHLRCQIARADGYAPEISLKRRPHVASPFEALQWTSATAAPALEFHNDIRCRIAAADPQRPGAELGECRTAVSAPAPTNDPHTGPSLEVAPPNRAQPASMMVCPSPGRLAAAGGLRPQRSTSEGDFFASLSVTAPLQAWLHAAPEFCATRAPQTLPPADLPQARPAAPARRLPFDLPPHAPPAL